MDFRIPVRYADCDTATKVFDQDQGYESTLRAVDDSLKNFGYGKSLGFLQGPSPSTDPGYTYISADYFDL